MMFKFLYVVFQIQFDKFVLNWQEFYFDNRYIDFKIISIFFLLWNQFSNIYLYVYKFFVDMQLLIIYVLSFVLYILDYSNKGVIKGIFLKGFCILK